MISEVLKKAREFEEKKQSGIMPEERPAYHLSPYVGWMNDPNGFSYYNGQYHMFYQYHPYSSFWGPMHWGHAVSKDLLHWEYLPAAMAPDEEFDKDGCFSGSAITLHDGRQLFMYTSVVNEDVDGVKMGVQTQSIAIGDGLDYEKYKSNPVLDKKSLPRNSSIYDFRDPKIYEMPDGTYRALVSNRNSRTECGRILLFSSNDCLKWRFEKIFIENDDRIGKMWECPDFFSLDGKYVFMSSAMDMLPDGLKYYSGNGTFYMIGDYDETAEKFTGGEDHAVDYGIDFYAPQTILTEDGRRIMIGWMQNWDTCNIHDPGKKWYGQMSVPRELSIKDGRLYQNPIKELEDMRKNPYHYKDILFESGEIALPNVKGRVVDLTVDINAADPDDVYKKFAIRFAGNEKYHTAVSFRPHEGILKIDRKFSGSRRAIMHQRRCAVGCRDGKIRLRLLLDRFSAEVFVNDGYKAMSVTIDTDPEADEVSFYVDGKAYLSVDKYDLEV